MKVGIIVNKKRFYLMLLLITFIPLISGNAETYDNFDPDGIVSCGENLITGIPTMITQTVRIAYIIIQVAVPVVLVVMGSLDLFKGISAQKEEEIKKGQQMFIKRLVAAAIIFFVFAITKVIISFAADGTSSKILNCAECFLENKCDS